MRQCAMAGHPDALYFLASIRRKKLEDLASASPEVIAEVERVSLSEYMQAAAKAGHGLAMWEVAQAMLGLTTDLSDIEKDEETGFFYASACANLDIPEALVFLAGRYATGK